MDQKQKTWSPYYFHPRTKKSENRTIIIHSGTNNLKRDTSPEEIARAIINRTTSCKTQTNKVILSSVVPR